LGQDEVERAEEGPSPLAVIGTFCIGAAIVLYNLGGLRWLQTRC
jgi:hypothetical protein